MSVLLTRAEVDNLTAERLEELLLLKVVEKTLIDYKSKLDFTNSRETYKELLKDISSFANSRGGLILIGVKEPEENQTREEQVVGIANCKDICANIERVCASSIEPRIPTLIITYVKIFEGKDVLVIFIPASSIKPHMVNYNKHRSFYIRHTESSMPMTVQEIRDSVLFSANLERTALNIAQNEEFEVLESFINDKPAFIMQAMPIVQLESSIDVQSEIVQNIVRGSQRQSGGNFCLNSMTNPTPTLKGIMGTSSRHTNEWITEIHRNGFIQLVHLIRNTGFSEKPTYHLYEIYTELFTAFLEYCQEIWGQLNIDVQYLLRCKIVNSHVVTYFPDKNFTSTERRFTKTQITFTNQIKNIGDDLELIYIEWEKQFINMQGRWN